MKRWKKYTFISLIIIFAAVIEVMYYLNFLNTQEMEPYAKKRDLIDYDDEVEVELNIPHFFPKKDSYRGRLIERDPYSNIYQGIFRGMNDEDGNMVYRIQNMNFEDVDCEEFNEEHLTLMKQKRVIFDIDERIESKGGNIKKEDIHILEELKQDYEDFWNHSYSKLCENQKIRMERRMFSKSKVNWTEGETVVILRKGNFPGHFSGTWYENMNKNCDVDFYIEWRYGQKSVSHVVLEYFIPKLRKHDNLRLEWFRNQSGSDPEHESYYRMFYTVESPVFVTHELYDIGYKHFDMTLGYHPTSEIVVYVDYDHDYRLWGLYKDKEVIKQYEFHEDKLKTREQLKNETIENIRMKNRSDACCICAISHCKFSQEKPMIRNSIIRQIHKRHTVHNLGRCVKHANIIEEENFAIRITEPKGLSTTVGKMYMCKNYPFFIAMENFVADGYSTDKLFDALLCKYSVPIYLGDPWIEERFEDGLLEKYKIFINIKDFDTITDLNDYLEYLMANETAYLEYFEWRWDKVILKRVQHPGMHDYFDKNGVNVVPYCRIAKQFVEERLKYYPEESRRNTN